MKHKAAHNKPEYSELFNCALLATTVSSSFIIFPAAFIRPLEESDSRIWKEARVEDMYTLPARALTKIARAALPADISIQ